MVNLCRFIHVYPRFFRKYIFESEVLREYLHDSAAVNEIRRPDPYLIYSTIFAPQFPQNFMSQATSAPQFGQTFPAGLLISESSASFLRILS